MQTLSKSLCMAVEAFNALSGADARAMVKAAVRDAERLKQRPALRPGPIRSGARYAAHIDRNRYTGAVLRAIRAQRGCGRPPKVLAARRAKAEAREAADLAAAYTTRKEPA